MKALFRCEKNWQKINVQRFSANFLFSKNGKCRSITYSGDFATLPSLFLSIFYALAFELMVSITFLIPIQTFISVNISTTLP